MTSRSRAVVFAVCAAVLIIGVAFVLHPRTPTPTAVTIASPNVTLARAAFAHYVTRIRAFGHVGTPYGGEAKLAFAGSGIVTKIDVRLGQSVTPGESLAELDTSGLAIDAAQTRSDAAAAAAAYGGGSVPIQALAGAVARLTVARVRVTAAENGTGIAQSDRATALAAVRQSEAKLLVDRSALDRQTALYIGGVTAEKDVEAARETLALDRADADANRAKAASASANIGAALAQASADVAQAESDVRAARAQVAVAGAQAASARARYDAAQRSLAMGTLRATANGVVTAILKQPGEAVDPTQPAIAVEPRSTNEVTLAVTGNDAGRVRQGNAVTMQVTSRGATGNGRVRAVLPGVDRATQTTTVFVVGAPAGAAPGDAVEATIDVAERRGIVIPTSAIVEDPQSGLAIVFVRERMRDGTEKFVAREISVASSDDRHALVEHGLRSGERVASQGAFDLLAPSGGS